jgi:hypothetical protein
MHDDEERYEETVKFLKGLRESAEAEEIVRILAKADPYYDGQEWWGCALCGTSVVGLDGHEPGCPWRLAVEWVSHPKMMTPEETRRIVEAAGWQVP